MRMTLSVARCKRGKSERETVSQAWPSQVAPGHAVPRVDRARTHPDALVILGSDDDRCTLVNLREQRGENRVSGSGERGRRSPLPRTGRAHALLAKEWDGATTHLGRGLLVGEVMLLRERRGWGGHGVELEARSSSWSGWVESEEGEEKLGKERRRSWGMRSKAWSSSSSGGA